MKNFPISIKHLADMLESYLYPAVARTFARNGFQWATQFAYDPIDLARYPTFLVRTYTFPLAHTLNPSDIEKVQLTVTALPSASPTTTLLEGIWLQ